jgi:hypothetical protein
MVESKSKVNASGKVTDAVIELSRQYESHQAIYRSGRIRLACA